MNEPQRAAGAGKLFAAHPRAFHENRFVYPVVSRRSGGVSIGVNLNRDKACNFDCIYCQVDRREPGAKETVELGRLAAELGAMVEEVTSGRIYEDPAFCATPAALRRLNDIALSGDGEPTAYRHFDDAVAVCAEVRRRYRLDGVKLVLITNASLLHRPRVQRALELLDASGGEIWGKLDAGTETYYREVARSAVPFSRILDNLLLAARARPIVIQSLFMRIRGEPPSPAEVEAYGGRLAATVAGGGRIKLVQVHTVARPPAESWVAALVDGEMDALAEKVRRQTGLPVATFYAPREGA